MSSEDQTSQVPKFKVPEGFTLHTENTTSILLPSDYGAFLNPVQEFNRDLSVACIRTWSEVLNESKEAKWRARIERQGQGKEKRGNKKQKSVYDLILRYRLNEYNHYIMLQLM